MLIFWDWLHVKMAQTSFNNFKGMFFKRIDHTTLFLATQMLWYHMKHGVMRHHSHQRAIQIHPLLCSNVSMKKQTRRFPSSAAVKRLSSKVKSSKELIKFSGMG